MKGKAKVESRKEEGINVKQQAQSRDFRLSTFAFLLCAFVAFAANAQECKPARNVDIAIASGAGGAADR